MTHSSGIADRRIIETPVAIVDFETTGLTPGFDRVVELSVVRVDPGRQPRLVLDTLVNPLRPMAATEIHGITDHDVARAPRFMDIAGDLLNAVAGCAVASYNVYFDMKFLNFELANCGVHHQPPHFCLMYMRPMLGLGSRCKLDEACQLHRIDYNCAHVAANDAVACGKLFTCYLEAMGKQGISTFGDLGTLKSYKFVESFRNSPLPEASAFGLGRYERLLSRSGFSISVDPTRQALAAYWDALKIILADLDITDEEFAYVQGERARLNLKDEQIRVLHARAFASVITQFTSDQWLDDREVRRLRRLHQCLSKLGWAPGE